MRFFGGKDNIKVQPITGIRAHRDEDGKPLYYDLLEYDYIKRTYGGNNNPTVGVIDSGIAEHDDLFGNVQKDYDFDGDGVQGDHGTHVAGIVSGNKYGLSYNIPLNNYKALGGRGSGSFRSLAEAVLQADIDEINIISLSIGAQDENAEVRRALSKYLTGRPDRFAIIATGNDHENGGSNTSDFPAWLAEEFPNIIAVGSGNIYAKGKATVSTFSSRGVVTVIGQGEEVLSTVSNNSHSYFSGTSMATPMVSACIAFAKGILPDFNCFDFSAIIKQSCIDLGSEGFDNSTGHGFLIPLQFLKYVEYLRDGQIERPEVHEIEAPCEVSFWNKFFAFLKLW